MCAGESDIPANTKNANTKNVRYALPVCPSLWLVSGGRGVIPVTRMNESWHRYECVIALVCTILVTRMHELCPTYERVMAHTCFATQIWRSPATMEKSCDLCVRDLCVCDLCVCVLSVCDLCLCVICVCVICVCAICVRDDLCVRDDTNREVGGWGRDPQKCTGRDWGMGSSTI